MPDLIVKTFTVPQTVTHDVEASGAMYVQNVGPGAAGAFTVDIYGGCTQESLSFLPKDVAGLEPGAEKFISFKFTFSHTGACFMGATIDSPGQVSETNETNNEVRVDITSQ